MVEFVVAAIVIAAQGSLGLTGDDCSIPTPSEYSKQNAALRCFLSVISYLFL